MAGVFQPNVFQHSVFQVSDTHVFQCNVFQNNVFQGVCGVTPPTLPTGGGGPAFPYPRGYRSYGRYNRKRTLEECLEDIREPFPLELPPQVPLDHEWVHKSDISFEIDELREAIEERERAYEAAVIRDERELLLHARARMTLRQLEEDEAAATLLLVIH